VFSRLENALRFNLAGVNSNSRVFVTAGEFGPDPTFDKSVKPELPFLISLHLTAVS